MNKYNLIHSKEKDFVKLDNFTKTQTRYILMNKNLSNEFIISIANSLDKKVSIHEVIKRDCVELLEIFDNINSNNIMPILMKTMLNQRYNCFCYIIEKYHRLLNDRNLSYFTEHLKINNPNLTKYFVIYNLTTDDECLIQNLEYLCQ